MGTYDHEVKVTAVLKVNASGGCKASSNGGPPNEALLLAAWGTEAAGSLSSRAAIMIERRSRAPRR